SSLVFGVDGWTDHTLRLENKGYTMSMVEENLRSCHQAGIVVAVNMVIGIPGETEEDVTETINNIIRCKRYIDYLQNINTLILAAGSEYYRNPEGYNIHLRGDRREIYEKHPYFIPPDLWYSDDPYIDQQVRVNRSRRIYETLAAAGVNITDYAKWEVERDSK
ncbi:radical SAM protein, partial [Chloroflexota bacterium]